MAGDDSLPINNEMAVARAYASIQDVRTALSVGSGERLHAHVTGYCRALLDCEIIDNAQWQALHDQAEIALNERRLASDVLEILPAWSSTNP